MFELAGIMANASGHCVRRSYRKAPGLNGNERQVSDESDIVSRQKNI